MNTIVEEVINIKKRLNTIANKKLNAIINKTINIDKGLSKLNNNIDKVRRLDISTINS